MEYHFWFDLVTLLIALTALVVSVRAHWKANRTTHQFIVLKGENNKIQASMEVKIGELISSRERADTELAELRKQANLLREKSNEIQASTEARIKGLIDAQEKEKARVALGRQKQWDIKTEGNDFWTITNIGWPVYGLKVETGHPGEKADIPGLGNTLQTDEAFPLVLHTAEELDPEAEETPVITSRYVILTWHRLPNLADNPRQMRLFL